MIKHKNDKHHFVSLLNHKTYTPVYAQKENYTHICMYEQITLVSIQDDQ